MDPSKIFEPLSRLRRTQPLVLELDLTEGVFDNPPTDPVGQLLALRRTRLADVVDGLRRAARDHRVQALVARVGGRPIGIAKVQELRAAIAEFRAAGKYTVAWTESFGELAGGTVPYYLASAFERIRLQPSGDLALSGLSIETHFLRGGLDKLGIAFEFGKRHEYKNAPNVYMEEAYTEPHREATERIISSMTERLVDDIAAARGLEPARVRELIASGPHSGEEAVEAGLVDDLAYRDEIYADLRKQFATVDGGEPRVQYVSRYVRSQALPPSLPQPQAAGVALVHGAGPIMLGRTRRGPGTGPMMGSDSITAALRAARTDDRVRAIVFRVDSPGGSYIASDAIWREVVLARKAGKPVVVSMGDFAASGGYFVAMAADTIVAQPGTLTGSIGVFAGKPVMSELLQRLGITTDAVASSENARTLSVTRAFSREEWDKINSWLDRVYDDFTAKAAEGRGMPVERLRELAKGRVWTGADAAANGLVDELGGLRRAVAIAREKGGLPADAPVRAYPQLGMLERLRPAESSEDRSAAIGSLRLDAWGPLSTLAARLGLPAHGPLMLPGDWTVR
ncbi:signal peptide peptidase SppA [Allonocardiopsis opalescens]|nr:signal peptide peptidase SppA [Allonocardiopsis opalescens]